MLLAWMDKVTRVRKLDALRTTNLPVMNTGAALAPAPLAHTTPRRNKRKQRLSPPRPTLDDGSVGRMDHRFPEDLANYATYWEREPEPRGR